MEVEARRDVSGKQRKDLHGSGQVVQNQNNRKWNNGAEKRVGDVVSALSLNLYEYIQ